MVKLFILLTVVLISGFTAVELMASEDPTLKYLQEELWVEGVQNEELPTLYPEDYLPEELAIALEKQAHIGA